MVQTRNFQGSYEGVQILVNYWLERYASTVTRVIDIKYTLMPATPSVGSEPPGFSEIVASIIYECYTPIDEVAETE